MLSVRFRVSRSAAPISSTPAPAMSEARTRWARVTLERFDRVDGFVWVMGALRDGWRKPGQANDAAVPASAMNDPPAWRRNWGEKESGRSGAPLELALLCRHRRQTASFCSYFVLVLDVPSQQSE